MTPQHSPYAFTIQRNGQTEVFFDPFPEQLAYLQATEPNLFLWGNRGGGKSHVARVHAHALALTHPGLKYIIVRRSYPELMKTHLAFLDDEMKKLEGTYNKTEHIAYYKNGSMGFYAQCASDADVKKVLGAEAALVVFDEAPELQWEWMVLIAASVRVPKGSGMVPMVRYLGNPIGPSIDDLWKYFIDKDVDPLEDPEYNPADWRAIELRLEHNPHLDATQYRKRFAGLPAHIRKAWLEGERHTGKAIFELKPTITVEEPNHAGQMVKVQRPYHVIDSMPTFANKPIIEQPWVRIYRSYDDGFDPDPAICLWFAVYGARILCFHEQLWHRTIIKDIAADIKVASPFPVVMTYCDPTLDINTTEDVLTKRDRFESYGIPMECSVNNREHYASAIHQALGEEIEPGVPKIQFLRHGCPYLIRYLPKMTYDDKNPRRMADHRHDHGPVALAYFLMSWSSASTTAPPRPVRNDDPSGIGRWRYVTPRSGRVLGSESTRR